ncbi:MAG TPA: hypothetical protein PK073_05855 [Ignavibacteriaceae bacterium]|jgi:hypothetical protein|nr:MAG: hypothetical protein BWY38_01892 [Ignavibacteria bacterium ADurb.Bin266]OQY74205.1 MAG: hypothetical protein B6D44_05190 [Ignavibacteriales bacterium UTCHB2]HQF42419.1 hypothetical protein [Ignavibacteriaceae bacterium]HQI39828.1 hypothetical protein [Ignavibacteriaceae bacterium]HQJ46221.1 hypothetical protein [Ignavibacteriaceae bacterium]
MKIKLPILFLTVFLFTSQLKAQFDFYAGYQGIADDNIYSNYLQISDFINTLSLGSAYNIESDLNNVQVYYEGSLNSFQKNAIKTFNAHKIGLVETHLFSPDENPLNAGINFSFRNNKDDFKIYDFNQLSLYANFRYSVSETDFIIPGYIFRRNNYKNFSLFSHNEHKFFLNWISSFESGTSIMLNAEYNFKKYFESYNYEGYLNETSQIKFMTKLSQALGEKTGINGYVTLRKNLSDGSRYLLYDTLIYYEEEIFNDIYSSDGLETGIGFKHYLSDDIELSADVKYFIRKYSSLNAMDLNSYELNELRKDKIFGIGAEVTYDLNKVLAGLSISAHYSYLTSKSNDYFYEYNNQMFSVSLIFDF